MAVVPMPGRGDQMPVRGEWFGDARDGDRALRVSWHAQQGFVVLSTWRGDACIGTVRLLPADAARLVGVLAHGLAGAASAAHGDDASTAARGDDVASA